MKKFFWLAFFAANLGIIFFIWWQKSFTLLSLGTAPMFISLGRLTGLIAVYLILWQLVLIGRLKILEKAFGLDKLALIHHANGLLAWLFILLHPIFLLLGYSHASNRSLLEQFSYFLFKADDLAPAFLSLLVFILVIFFSYLAMRKKIKYELWYFIHLSVYLAIIWAYGHQLELGQDLQSSGAAAYWYLIYFLAVASLIYFRLLKPLYFLWRHRFEVSEIKEENDNIVSLYIRGKDLEKFKFNPGQFAIFRFLDKAVWFEAHPFSFSQAPNGRELRLSIKALGDFTKKIKEKIKPGTLVFIDGPHGIFSPHKAKSSKLALIAGGIGITPIFSIAQKEECDTVLFYSAVWEKDLIFKKDLEALAEKKSLRNIFILSGETDWEGEKGLLDEEKIKRLMPDYKEREFFLCGPPLMTKGVKQSLIKLGIRKDKIHFEKFSLN